MNPQYNKDQNIPMPQNNVGMFTNENMMPVTINENPAGPSIMPVSKDLPYFQQEPRSNLQYPQYPQNPSPPIIISEAPNNIPNVVKQEVPVKKVVIIENRTIIADDYYPSVSFLTAILILLLNIILPGVGTMLISCTGTMHPGYFMCVGIFQLILTCIIIGWIWAILSSVVLLSKSH